MKKILKGYLLGFLSAAILASGVTYASNTTTLYNVIANGIKIVVDGKKITPTDANGKIVEPIIYNGTTYLPVRAVANALGKAVSWDGPNYTVYLGKVPNILQYPTLALQDAVNIGKDIKKVNASKLTDNYGNSYSSAIYASCNYGGTFQTLLNMKYSKFKGTIYVPNGCSESYSVKVLIKADGKTIYSSPEITKTSSPIPIDLNITGCNDFQIEISGLGSCYLGYIADGGFYQ